MDLPGARGAHQRDRLAGADLQRHVAQRPGRLPALVLRNLSVAEPHAVELDVAADRAQLGRPARVAHVGLGVEQVEDLVDRGHPLLVGRVQVRELLDRVEEALQVADERDQHADRDVAVERPVAAVQHDHRGADRGQELDAGEVGGVQLDGAVVGGAVLVVQLRKALLVARLLAERAHDPHAGEGLLQVRGDVRDPLPHGPERARRVVPEQDAPDGEQRERGEEGHERQRHVEQQQDHDRPDQRQRAREERHDAVRDELVECLHVVGQARDQHARLAAAEEADRLALQVREDAQPQVLQRALPDPAHEVGLHVRRAPVDQRGQHECGHDPVQRLEVPRADAVVDRELGEIGRREAGRGREHERDHRHDHAPAIGAQQLGDALQPPRALAPGAAHRRPQQAHARTAAHARAATASASSSGSPPSRPLSALPRRGMPLSTISA